MSFLGKRKGPFGGALYFLTEILIVVVGILFAVQLNNWNESRKSRIEEIKSLRSFIKDLEKEKIYLTNAKHSMRSTSEYLTEISDGNVDSVVVDSLIHYMDREYFHQSLNSSYINLKSGGNLNTISNDSLKQELVGFYEGTYSVYKILSTTHTDFIYTNMRPYIIHELEVGRGLMVDKGHILNKLKDPVMVNLIHYQIGICSYIDFLLRPKTIDKLLEKVKEELNQLES